MHTHPGPCTEGRTYTRDEAVARLAELGYAFDERRCDFWRGDAVGTDGEPADRGRLGCIPDYCTPDEYVGVRWFLQRPYTFVEVQVLP